MDEEIKKLRDKNDNLAAIKESVLESEQQLSEQSLHEEELIDDQGEFVIFAGLNPQSAPGSFLLNENMGALQALSTNSISAND